MGIELYEWHYKHDIGYSPLTIQTPENPGVSQVTSQTELHGSVDRRRLAPTLVGPIGSFTPASNEPFASLPLSVFSATDVTLSPVEALLRRRMSGRMRLPSPEPDSNSDRNHFREIQRPIGNLPNNSPRLESWTTALQMFISNTIGR